MDKRGLIDYTCFMITRIKPYIPYICFFLVFYALLWPIQLLSGSDDTAHFEMLNKLGVPGWVLYRAETWQPRLFSDFFYAAFIYRLGAWKVVNAAMAALLMLGVNRASFGPDFLEDAQDSQKRARLLVTASSLICLLFFFIYPNAVTSSSIWYTGSFYYLWPITAMIFGLTPFIFFLRGGAPYPHKAWIPVGILASICASFTEQTALVSVGVSWLILILCLVKRRKVPVLLFVHFAVILVVAAGFFYFNFSSARLTNGEELKYLPEFATFGLRDKLVLGVNVYDLHLLRSSNLLFLVLALLAGLLAYARLKKRHFCLKAIVFFPAFYILLNILPLRYIFSGFWNYTAEYAKTIGMPTAFGNDPSQWFDFLYKVPPLGWGLQPRDLFMAAIALAAVLFMIYPLYFAFKKKADGLLAALLYLASFCSGIILGFSPSVFASGSRPFFLSNIFILLLCAMLVREGMTDEDPQISNDFLVKTKRSKLVLAVISLIAVYSFLMYKFVFASVYYWWY